MKLKILTIIIIILTISNISVNATETVFSSVKGSDQKTAFSDSQWEQINENGFGNEFNVAPRGIVVFNDSLLVGITNADFYNGSLSMILGKPMSIRQALREYLFKKDGNTYNATGCEIWCYNGTSWRAIVGNYTDATPAGFGDKNNTECSTLIEYKNYLYAGIWNEEGCQIWRTNDLRNWEQVVFRGFGDKDNICAMSALVFKNDLYFGTVRWNGSEIYKTNDGLNWIPVVGGGSDTEPGFGVKYRSGYYIWSMCEYNSELYVGTANNIGAEIWKSSDGLKWEPVIAYDNISYARKNGADYPRGFGKYWAGPVRNMIVFNDELYLFCSIRGYARVTIEAFGKKWFDLSFVIPLDVLKYPTFNLVPRSGQIWKYNATTDKWTRVVGGWGKTNNSAGFGDRLNQYLWSVIVFDGNLYVGTLHSNPNILKFKREGLLNWTVAGDLVSGKAELWRTSDGKNWEKAINDGFGDEYNFGIRSLEIYKNKLYACTVNMKSGCEVWRYDPLQK